MLMGFAIVLMDLLKNRFLPPADRLSEIDIPVLCLWGEKDSWVPLSQGEELIELIPNAKLVVIPEEGHCPMETAPDIFNVELLYFLDQSSASGFGLIK